MLFSLIDLFWFLFNVGDFVRFLLTKFSVENLKSLLSVQRALPAWLGNTMLAGSGTACLKLEFSDWAP